MTILSITLSVKFVLNEHIIVASTLKCTESLTYFHFYPKNALLPVTMSFIQENIFSVGWLLNVMICIEKFMLLSMYLAPEVSLV